MKPLGHTRADVCSRLTELLSQLRERRFLHSLANDAQKPRVSDALRDLCAGSITVEDYLNLKVDLAIRPLEALLRPDDILAVRIAMSERISSEPIWRRVVEELRAATSRESP